MAQAKQAKSRAVVDHAEPPIGEYEGYEEPAIGGLLMELESA